MLCCIVAPLWSSQESSSDLMKQIGSKIIIGFHGTSSADPEVQQIIAYAQKGLIGGVVLFSYNIVSKEQLKELLSALRAAAPYRLRICIDQEGGRVQRLRARHGGTDYLSPLEVAQSLTVEQAQAYYGVIARELKEVGITCNLGPVVDLHTSEAGLEPNPVIGGLKRSFDSDVKQVVSYAEAFIKAHEQEGMNTCLKHYPGHGLATADTHKGLVDITYTHEWSERAPYVNLIKRGYEGMVMPAHLIHRAVDEKYPATLSQKILSQWLRKEDGFQGVIISDDFHMGAIQRDYGLEEVIIHSINAGIDLLLFSNNPAANQTEILFEPDPRLPEKIITIVLHALEKGRIAQETLDMSSQRLASLS